jgi:putative ubiquitin-RnfH superfamily antitoxin RatB of RatAB toxin-antitoxin module
LNSAKHIDVEVAFALPDRQRVIGLSVLAGTTALAAVEQSGIFKEFPEINADRVSMGIFSQVLDGKSAPLPQHYVLAPRDRVELYRPLLIDPKEGRRRRALIRPCSAD